MYQWLTNRRSCAHIYTCMPTWNYFPAAVSGCNKAQCMPTDRKLGVDQELAGSTFKDERLGRRLRKLLVQMAGAVGAPIPLACQDWANTKAAYRFLSNEAVGEAEIFAGHFHATRSRVAAADGPILVLQDTTEFSYQRARPEQIGCQSARERDPG